MSTLHTIGQLFMDLLPVAGTILLIYLIFLVRSIIQTLRGVDKTIEDVDIQIKKLDDPLNTAIELCHTIDEVHHSSKEAAIKGAAQYKEKKEEFAAKIEAFKTKLIQNETASSLEKESLEILNSQETKDNRELIEKAKHTIIDIYANANAKIKASNTPEKVKDILSKARKQTVVVLNATRDKVVELKNK